MWQFWLISAHTRFVSVFTNISLNNCWMSTVMLPDRKKYALNSRTWICSFCVRALAISVLSKPEPEKNIGAFALTFSISLAFKLPTLRDWLAWLEKIATVVPRYPHFPRTTTSKTPLERTNSGNTTVCVITWFCANFGVGSASCSLFV